MYGKRVSLAEIQSTSSAVKIVDNTARRKSEIVTLKVESPEYASGPTFESEAKEYHCCCRKLHVTVGLFSFLFYIFFSFSFGWSMKF